MERRLIVQITTKAIDSGLTLTLIKGALKFMRWIKAKSVIGAAAVLAWANGYAAALKRRFIRMVAWENNQRLVQYYVACGFRHVRNRQIGLVPELPAHYQNASLALFENEIQSFCVEYHNTRST
jgi:hypothetical protein